MFLLIEDKDLLKKYDDIWNNVRNSMKNDFDSELICNKVKSNYTCLAVILIEFVL